MQYLGFFVGLFVMAVIYVFSMYAYIAARKKWSHSKYAVEIVTVLAVLLFCVGVKSAITLPAISKDTFGTGLANFFYAIYSAFGFLTFQGMEGFGELETALLKCLYSGSSLYAALMFVSVITAKASYEIYCWIQLRALKIALNFTSETDVYLFTAVTEEALLLANDICDNEIYEKKKTNKKRKCKIIFSGDSLSAFDRSNPLHREIMANGYLYWSYSKKSGDKQEKSMLKRLGLYVKNDYLDPDTKKKKIENRIHIFALNKNERLSGLESENADIVFKEIKAIVQESQSDKGKNRKKSVIDFYVLTDTAINYEYYHNRLEKTVGKENPCRFQIHIINEALIAGKCFAQKRIAQLKHNPNNPKIPLSLANQPNPDNFYRTIVLGFGDTGREALKTLYIDTAFIKDNSGEPSQFVADVYDTKMDEISGMYSLSHPLVLCRNCGKDIPPINFSSAEINYGNIESIYGGKENFIEVNKSMKFPIVGFHKASCFDLKFADYFNNAENETTQKINALCYAFIITLGDDERNIAMANSLIDGLKHKFTVLKNEKTPLCIYVHLRDEKNSDRINWTDDEAKKHPYLKIVKFGNRTDIYSYENIIDVTEDMKYDYGYNLIGDKATSVYTKCADLSKVDSGFDCEKALKEIQEEICGIDACFMTESWLALSMFAKESNAAANRFGAYFHETLTHESVTASLLTKLTRLEHERWSRFHIANGWTYAPYDKNEKAEKRAIKEHNYLCPFDMLSEDVQKNDLVNVALALAYKEKTEHGIADCRE